MNAPLPQTVNDLKVMRLFEKTFDMTGNYWPNIRHFQQLLLIRRHQVFERTKMLRKVTRGCLAHFAYTQRKNKPRQTCLLGFFQCVDQVLRRLFAHALQAGQLIHLQGKQIINMINKFFVDQLFNQFIAQPVHIHRLARGKMFNRFFALRLAEQSPAAAGNRFTFLLQNIGITYWTMSG